MKIRKMQIYFFEEVLFFSKKQQNYLVKYLPKEYNSMKIYFNLQFPLNYPTIMSPEGNIHLSPDEQQKALSQGFNQAISLSELHDLMFPENTTIPAYIAGIGRVAVEITREKVALFPTDQSNTTGDLNTLPKHTIIFLQEADVDKLGIEAISEEITHITTTTQNEASTANPFLH